MGKVKIFLLYAVFWVLGICITSFIVILGSSFKYFLKMLNDGVGDPHLFAEGIAQLITSWIMFIPVLMLISYSAYFILSKKIKYAGFVTALIVAIVYFLLRALFAGKIYNEIGPGLWSAIIFIPIALMSPSWIIRKKKTKREKLAIVETFK